MKTADATRRNRVTCSCLPTSFRASAGRLLNRWLPHFRPRPIDLAGHHATMPTTTFINTTATTMTVTTATTATVTVTMTATLSLLLIAVAAAIATVAAPRRLIRLLLLLLRPSPKRLLGHGFSGRFRTKPKA